MLSKKSFTGWRLLALDADYGTLDLWDTWEMLYGHAGCIYTTHSHTAEAPRLRLLIPLSRDVSPEEYEAVGRRVAEALGIEAFDDTTYEPNRLMFWPSTPADGEYVFQYADGPWLDVDAVLAEYADWRDMREWPVSSRTAVQRHRRAEKQADPRDKAGVVGAFCRVYDVPAAIDTFLSDVYEPSDEGRYTYRGGTTSGGLVVYDGGDFAYSHHDSDPAGGRLCNAFDLVRIHLYGTMDRGREDQPVPPSFAAMKTLCNEQPQVLEEMEARIRETAREDFGDTDDTLGRYASDYTEQGNAIRFADTFGNVLRYNKNLGWLFWDGMRWLIGAKEEALLLGMRFADTLLEEATILYQRAADKEEKDAAKAAYAWAKRTRSSQKIENLLKLTAPLVMEKDIESFDPDPWLLNTPAGIVDLRTGEVAPHDPDKRCTKLCAVLPTRGDTPLWSALLARMTNGSEAFTQYLQRLFGMAAVGAVYEEGMVIPYGPGGNGKSTLTGAISGVLGDYAGTIRPELLLTRANGAEPFGLEQVYRKRLVVAAETDEGAKLSISIVKRLTSRDPINANPKQKDPFSFNPTHTLILHTNHLPRLRSLDGGTRRRIAVAPFENVIPGGEMIPDYGKRLQEQEGGMILGWVIEGARLFWAAGCKLAKPEAVQTATKAYLEAEDWLNGFLEDRCEADPKFYVRGADLYAAYRAWAELNGEYVRRNNDFAAELEKRGFRKEHKKVGSVWFGLRQLEGDI